MDHGGPSNNLSKLFARRHTVTSHQLSVESRNYLLTSSLPMATLPIDRSKSVTINGNIAEVENEFEGVEAKSVGFNRSYSGESTLSPPNSRPRSASLHNNLATASGLRRTLRTMSGRRPSSASKNRPSSASKGWFSKSGSIDHQEAKTVSSKVETTFATVRKQLTDLSAEDSLLQERMNKLSSEITAMQRYVASLNTAKKLCQASRTSATLPVVSGKHTLTPPLNRDSWEDIGSHKGHEDEVFLRPRYLSLQGNTCGSDGNDSIGSRNGSLADSEGSVSSLNAPHSVCEGSVSSPNAPHSTCSIIIIDHDKEVSFPTPTTGERPRKSVTGYEDDVFLT